MGRVVITGMGVVAANANGLQDFEAALRSGRSGIRFMPRLKELSFGCQVVGVPQGIEELKRERLPEEALLNMNSAMTYGSIAGLECWNDAGLSDEVLHNDEVDWDTGAIIGTGIGGADTLGELVVPRVNAGKVRRLGSSSVEQTMGSAVSARLAGFLGLGGQVTANSSACSTGTEAIINAYLHLREGRAKRMLAGGAEGTSPYIWSGFDAMRVLARTHNDHPEQASRPLSASASGFVPASGAGVLMLETLDSALQRGARIYAEVLGGHVNCGGQRAGGSLTAPSPEGVRRCIRSTLLASRVGPEDIDVINGHLTATMADPIEVKNWTQALELPPERFPKINSTKSLVGHALGAAGGIECVAGILQLAHGFIHGSANCEDLHPGVQAYAASIPQHTIESDAQILAKASFGFGDVNACVLFKKWNAAGL